MKRLLSLGLALRLALGLAACAGPAAGPACVSLIDGDKGLANWNQLGDANWRAEGGLILADRVKCGFLVSKETDRSLPQLRHSSGQQAWTVPVAAPGFAPCASSSCC